MDEKDRPQTDLDRLVQQGSERFAIEQSVLAPKTFVTEYLEVDPPRVEQADVVDIIVDSVDQALTLVTFQLHAHTEGPISKLARLGGFDYRAVRGELERWASACQNAYGGVGPLPEVERLRRVLRPPG